jgi:hypothetical protein
VSKKNFRKGFLPLDEFVEKNEDYEEIIFNSYDGT